MKKIALYSSSRSSAAGRANPAEPTNLQKTSEQPHQSPSGQPTGHSPRSGWRSFRERYERPLWVGAAALLALLVVLTHVVLNPPARQITQEDIESAVLHTLETSTLPSPAAKAYERHSAFDCSRASDGTGRKRRPGRGKRRWHRSRDCR